MATEPDITLPIVTTTVPVNDSELGLKEGVPVIVYLAIGFAGMLSFISVWPATRGGGLVQYVLGASAQSIQASRLLRF